MSLYTTIETAIKNLVTKDEKEVFADFREFQANVKSEFVKFKEKFYDKMSDAEKAVVDTTDKALEVLHSDETILAQAKTTGISTLKAVLPALELDADKTIVSDVNALIAKLSIVKANVESAEAKPIETPQS